MLFPDVPLSDLLMSRAALKRSFTVFVFLFLFVCLFLKKNVPIYVSTVEKNKI